CNKIQNPWEMSQKFMQHIASGIT
ncbi:MAG: hypothetical protein RLZZ350_2648, partial [Verrucomicrobiota bacterium]